MLVILWDNDTWLIVDWQRTKMFVNETSFNAIYDRELGVILNLRAGRIIGAPYDWFKQSRDCDVGDPSFRTVSTGTI